MKLSFMNFNTGVLVAQIDWKSHFGPYEIRSAKFSSCKL